MIKYATRVFNDDFESKESEIRTLAAKYGVEEIKDKGRVLFFLFAKRKQANDFGEEIYETYNVNTKTIEWYKESEE